MLALALFAVGVVEYGLATLWTRVVVSRRIGATALVTFVNVMMWGFVITSLEPGNPGTLVLHGLGCAIGAAFACQYGTAPEEAPEAVPRRSTPRYQARRAPARARRRSSTSFRPDVVDRDRSHAHPRATSSPARRSRRGPGSRRTSAAG